MGRARRFDRDEALAAALLVFWRKGFDGATLTDLTGTMGISAPSLYLAFGDKEGLFREVLTRYGEQPEMAVADDLSAPGIRVAIERFLRSAVVRATDPATPPGCLLVHGALVTGRGGETIRDELAARRHDELRALHERLERARTEGELAPDRDVGALARYVMVVRDGISVEAVGGATAADLHPVVDAVLSAFPARAAQK